MKTSNHTIIKSKAKGHFHNNEVAIMGLPCPELKQLVFKMCGRLPNFKIAYLEADHNVGESGLNEALNYGISYGFVNKINHVSFDFLQCPKEHEIKRFFDQADLVIVNGNHFEASKQILVLDQRKPLSKKIDKITNPVLLLENDSHDHLPMILKEKLPALDKIERFKLSDIESISRWVESLLPPAPIQGLILAGGKSTRMGRDKASIHYHNQDQVSYLHQLLSGIEIPVLVSKANHNFQDDETLGIPILTDTFTGLGPMGAILSAFRHDPSTAWLVIACDLPLVTQSTLKKLFLCRNPSSVATCFQNTSSGFPEPLITIWEPKSYPLLLHFLSLGITCPRKVLINTDSHVIMPDSQEEIMNANTPEEYEIAMINIKNKNSLTQPLSQ